MASSVVETQVTWAAAASKTVSVNTIQWSDAMSLNIEDWDSVIQVSADNAGTAASGDTCTVYLARTTGDILGDSGNDFDSDEHAEFVMQLDTFATNTPGEDPARKSAPVNLSGCNQYKIGVTCAQAATRNIVVRVRHSAHRPQ